MTAEHTIPLACGLAFAALVLLWLIASYRK